VEVDDDVAVARVTQGGRAGTDYRHGHDGEARAGSGQAVDEGAVELDGQPDRQPDRGADDALAATG